VTDHRDSYLKRDFDRTSTALSDVQWQAMPISTESDAHVSLHVVAHVFKHF